MLNFKNNQRYFGYIICILAHEIKTTDYDYEIATHITFLGYVIWPLYNMKMLYIYIK